jgi:hypothetical protein
MPVFIQCPRCYKLNDTYSCECGWFKIMPNQAHYIICDIEPYLDGHMAQNPVPIKSRQHKAEELKKRGLFIK